MARLTSDFWVSAYIRTMQNKDCFAVLRKRGAQDAGAIFITIDRLDGTYDLYGPASQTAYDIEKPFERNFSLLMDKTTTQDIIEKLEREGRFDPDFWHIEVESPSGEHGLIIAQDEN